MYPLTAHIVRKKGGGKGGRDELNSGWTSMALSASLSASGRAMSLVSAAARLVYPRASVGLRLIDSEYRATDPAKSPLCHHRIVSRCVC
jgi:hypothetical protein